MLLARARARPAGHPRGTGTARLLLLGHLDTVVAHDRHRPLHREGGKLVGSGRDRHEGRRRAGARGHAGAGQRPEAFAEVALLLVCDEEWRTGGFAHVARFAGWDACLCFEGGERPPTGEDGVIVRRKAAGTVRVTARGRAAHSGSAPDRGRNALLALADAAQAVAACHDPAGPDRLTAVPTILQRRRGVQRRARRRRAVLRLPGRRARRVRARARRDPGRGRRRRAGRRAGPPLAGDALRARPSRPVLERAAAALGRPLRAASRGGASDASHFAVRVPVTIDGLGPRGGRAHNPEEFVHEDSLAPRAEVALAVVQRPALGAASDSSSRGRSSASSSPFARVARTAATPPFLKSTVPPVRSCTTCVNDGSWPTTSTRPSSPCASSSSSASSRPKPSASTSTTCGSMLSAWQAAGGVERPHLRARVAGVELHAEPREALAGGDGLPLAARRQLAIGVGLGIVRNGLSVTKEPELRRHSAVTLPASARSSNCQ